MYKRIISVFVVIILLFSLIIVADAEEMNISAECAILMAAKTNEVLYAKNAYARKSMASTTKIMTSLLAIESGRLDEEFTVTKEMVTVEGTSIGLLPGDQISLEELVLGMLLESGNDAANSTAYAISGSIEQFSVLMNQKAKEIGMNNSSFVTPSGLDNENHYSTAYDMAVLGSYAVKNTTFLNMCSTYSAYVEYGNPPYRRCFTNHNKMLKYYEGAVGIKTGFTKKSGRCLVSAAEKNGVMLVCVTLNAPNDWNDHKKLFDYGFNNVKEIELDSSETVFNINVVGANLSNVTAQYQYEPVAYGFNLDIEYDKIVKLQKFLYAPVYAGDVVGCAEYYDKNGVLLFDIPIVAMTDVLSDTYIEPEEKKDSLLDYIKKFFSRWKND